MTDYADFMSQAATDVIATTTEHDDVAGTTNDYNSQVNRAPSLPFPMAAQSFFLLSLLLVCGIACDDCNDTV